MNKIAAICLMLLSSLSTIASAQHRFRIVVIHSTGSCGGSQTYSYNQTGDVTLTIPSCAIRVEILGGASDSEALSNSIPEIELLGGPSGQLDIVLGHTLVTADVEPTPAALNWGGLEIEGLNSNTFVRFSGAIAGNLNGHVAWHTRGSVSHPQWEVDGGVRS